MGYLVADGVNDYCTIPNALTGNAGTDAYTIEFRAAFPTTPAGTRFLIGVGSGTSSNGFGIMTTGAFSVFAGGSARYSAAAGFIIFDTTFRTYRLEHDAGGAWRAYRDGSLISSGTYSTSNAFVALGLFFRIHPTSTGYIACNLEYCTVTGLGNSASWEANLSGGTGSILPTVGGTNNATLINFPTDNSQWQGFSSAVTIAVNGQLPKITGALTLNEINPSYVISVSGQLPKITGAVALNEINPAFTVSVAGQLPKLTGSIALNQFDNNRQATVIGVLPKLTGAITLNRIQPNNQVAVSGQLPKITASITLRVPDSYPSANPNDYTVSAYISTDSAYTARLSESSTINAIISASSTFNARLN